MAHTHALVIDDNAINVEILVSLLDAQGVASTALYTPGDLEHVLANRSNFDLVFLDLEMPRQSGYEVFAYLRQHINPAIPIVAYTVHISEINTVRQLGFHSFLGKPLDTDRFPGYLTQILNGEQVWIVP